MIPEKVMNNLEQLIPELNPVDKGKYYLATCPSCGRRELYIYKNKDFLVCNRLNKCGYVNKIFDYLKEERGLSPYAYFKLINSITGEDKTEMNSTNSFLKLPENIRYFSEEKEGFTYNKAKKYLLNRNIPENIINKLGYIADDTIKIFIPFYEDEKLVYYTFRETSKDPYLRWIDPKGINKHDFVYNLDEMYNTDTIFIFEGLMDALSLENQVGTAMMTSRIGKTQVKKILSTFPKNIILVPDIDKAGLFTLKRNLQLFKDYTPPDLTVNYYVYYVDIARKNKIEDISSRGLGREKENENELIGKLKGYKDFNETGKNYIDLNDCIKQDKAQVFYDLKSMFNR